MPVDPSERRTVSSLTAIHGLTYTSLLPRVSNAVIVPVGGPNVRHSPNTMAAFGYQAWPIAAGTARRSVRVHRQTGTVPIRHLPPV